jgi:NTP pyrophosphatase (non-canonical NTP hydrolase)
MEIKEYQEKSIRTLAKLETPLQDDLHMVMGMQTEAGEITDAYKKHMAYGKKLDLVNVKEELGDLMWYVSGLCHLHGWDLRDILQTNIDKLRARYPENFDSNLAQNRDLATERNILEKGK